MKTAFFAAALIAFGVQAVTLEGNSIDYSDYELAEIDEETTFA